MRSVLLLCAFCVGKHFTISLLAGVLPPEDHVGGCSKQCPKKPASQLAREAITLRTHYHLPGLERKVSTTRKLLPAKRCIEQNTPVEPAPEPKAKPQPKKTLPRKKAVVSVSGGSEPQRAEGSGSTGSV